MGTVNVRRLLLCVLLISAPLVAQTGTETKRPAAIAPQFEASVGYVYDSVSSASVPRIGLHGVDADGLMRLAPRWAARIDLTFARAGNVAGTGYAEKHFSGMIGPVFYLMQREKTEVFVHALAGMAWVDSAVPISSTAYFKGYETRPSFAFGGAVERAISGPFAVRIGADYQRTTFVNSALALQGQNNLRVTTSLVYRFANR